MRLLLTVVPPTAKPQDVAVEVDADGVVGDVAAALADQVPALRPQPAGAAGLRLVGAPEVATATQTPEHVSLYLGDEALDPHVPLAQSAVRHGCVLGFGAPVGSLAEPRGAVELRVVSGPTAGTVVRWDPGEYVIGAGPDSDLQLRDPALADGTLRVRVDATGAVLLTPGDRLRNATAAPPQRHRPLPGPIVLQSERATEQPPTRRRMRRRKTVADAAHERVLPDGTDMVDPNEPAPLVHLERRVLTGTTPWSIGETLRVGATALQRSESGEADAALSPSPSGATLDFNRPPRLLPPERETSFILPTKPQRPEKQPFPLAMMLLPVLMGVGMYYMTRSPYSLLIIAFSPLMALSSHTTTRRVEKRRYRHDMDSWTKRMKRIQGKALDALIEERTSRRRDFADAAEVLVTAVGPRARLWERRPSDPDWLVARVGTADQLSDVSINDQSSDDNEGPVAWTAPDVPVTIPLAEAGVTGVAGPYAERVAVARLLLAQTAALHSPTQLSMVLMTAEENAADWDWVRWLPHLRSDPDQPELALLGTSEETWARRINQLCSRLAQSAERAGGHGQAPSPPPVLVVLDGSRKMRLMPGMVTLLQAGPRFGIYFLCLDDDARLLPEECQAVVALRGDGAGPARGTVTRTGERPVEEVTFDLATAAWAERVARSLAPVRDVTDVDASTALPDSSRLLDVMELDVRDARGIEQRWQQVGRTTAALVGESAEGKFFIDIRKDGPHGLVAGTTGSGKSELLQTVIASLAAQNRPDEMNFVLVDYKGGAAFKDCNNLPHTVGMVTDLDGHLTTRALDSLGAELRRREHQLAGADANDIEDYLAAKGPEDEPMPRLLIVIDEFAALVAELPDFVTGLVDIARRGRSLGVHLILATQRPAGVVSAEIKSNTNLRIALRVTDVEDSGDVIESPVAAHISKSTPGRAYARLGHSSLVPFQSSRVGGRPADAAAPAKVRLRDMSFRVLGAAVEEEEIDEEEDASTPTDLAMLVSAANAASEQTGIHAPPPPWLPALPEQITLDQLLADFPDAVPDADTLAIPFGLVDIPREQRRDVATYDIVRDGHLAIVGASRSGRSYILRALAGVIGRFIDPQDVHVYGVDCGNNALLPLVNLPHVGAVVSREQTDRMARLVARLMGIVSERQQQLALAGFADIGEQRANVDPDDRMPYLLILFDRWEGFVQAYDSIDNGRLVDAWMQLLQEGAAAGLRIVMTGDRSLTFGRLATLTEDKMMLRVIDPSDFGAIGMTSKQVPNHMPDGRLFRAKGLREIQVLLHDEDPAGTVQVAALQRIARAATERHTDVPFDRRPFHVDVLPVRMTTTEAAGLGNQIEDTVIPFAVGGDTLQYIGLDALRHGPGLLVTGPRGSGRSTALLSMATNVLGRGWHVVVVTPRLSVLRHLDGLENVHGHFTGAEDEQDALTEILERMRNADHPSITIVDDLELVDIDGWLAEVLEEHLAGLRDTGSVLVAAGSAPELESSYRGPASVLKRSGSGLMLSPQSTSDTDMFGATLPRSALGVPMPPGSGYLVTAGKAQRVQVAIPVDDKA